MKVANGTHGGVGNLGTHGNLTNITIYANISMDAIPGEELMKDLMPMAALLVAVLAMEEAWRRFLSVVGISR